jgi:hypothetical protein
MNFFYSLSYSARLFEMPMRLNFYFHSLIFYSLSNKFIIF